MKKILFIFALAFTLQLSAQDKANWITDNNVAQKQSEAQNKPILVFVTNNQKTQASEILNKEFFSSEAFKNMTSKVVLLKLDISDSQLYNVRLGVHYLNKRSATGLALVNKFSNRIGEPLIEINTKNIETFVSFVNSKL